jgi:hypothetical protein
LRLAGKGSSVKNWLKTARGKRKQLHFLEGPLKMFDIAFGDGKYMTMGGKY